METQQNKIERLYELFALAMLNHLVRTKTDFADMIGIERGTLSYAFNGDTRRANLDRLIPKIEELLKEKGVTMNGNTLIGDNNTNNQNTDTPPELLSALQSAQHQIDTLLEQQGKFLDIINNLSK